MVRLGVVSLMLIVWTFGCTSLKMRISKQPMVRIPPREYPRFTDNMHYDGLAHGISQSISYLKRMPDTKKYSFGKDEYLTPHMIYSLEAFLSFVQKKPAPRRLQAYIEENFRVYKSVGAGKPGRVLFTGYYEPILNGRAEQSDTHRYPIYARPEDHVSVNLSMFSDKYKGKTLIGRHSEHKIVPYYDRKEIEEEGALKGKAVPLAWLDDPVDLFFLQIQGSGKVYLDTGQMLNVHYHTSNGHPYRSIGKLLIDEGKIPRAEMSMQAIRAYLKNNPHEVQRILNYNPSYVFFKIEPEGPIGYLSVRLTPGRSIALDRRIFPPAALTFISTRQPFINGGNEIDRWADFSGFALNQDTGGAIRGPGRADVFWGNGPYAEIAAGHLQHHGALFFLVLKPKMDGNRPSQLP